MAKVYFFNAPLPEQIQYHMQKNREYINKKSFKLSESINNELRETFRNRKPKQLSEAVRKKLRGFEYCEHQGGKVSNFFKGLGKVLKFIK